MYDLLRWLFQEEAVSLLQQHEGTLLWQEGLLQLFRCIEANRAVCLCALRSVGREHLKRFFEADTHAIIHRTVEQIGTEVGALRAAALAGYRAGRLNPAAADAEWAERGFGRTLRPSGQPWKTAIRRFSLYK